MECPNLTHKEMTVEKKKFSKHTKGKIAYIAWDENDSTTSSSSKDEEEINLCLMAKEQSEVSSARSSIYLNKKNYSTLLQAFFEIHDEANKLALANNRLKGLNNWLEKRVNSLEEELEIMKTDFEHLNMIFQFSNQKGESSKPTKCKNCEVLQAKVKFLVKTSSKLALKFLVKTSSKLALGTSNLNAILGSQNYVFDKAGIKYKPIFKKKTRKIQ